MNRSGLRISWYKYIGRGMSSNRQLAGDEFMHILSGCAESLAQDEIAAAARRGGEDG